MDLLKFLIYLISIVLVFLIPLLITPKSKRLYKKVWLSYVLTCFAIIISATWGMVQAFVSSTGSNYVSMSPIGDITIWKLIHVALFLVSIPVFLYCITLGLPWIAFRKHDSK